MKKLVLICTAILLLSACDKDPEWSEIDHIYYNGDVDLIFDSHIVKLQNLIDLGYNAIDGNLYIENFTRVKKLDLLESIYVVTGSVVIKNADPVDLFDNLVSIGGSLHIEGAYEISDFPKLDSVKSITFTEGYFVTINGFDRLDTCDQLLIQNHFGQVSEISAFPVLQKTGDLHLNLNQRSDTDFLGLENLHSCKTLVLENVGNNALLFLEEVEERLEIRGTNGSSILANCVRSDTIVFRNASSLDEQLLAHSFTAPTLDIIKCNEIVDLNWTNSLDSVVQCRIVECNQLQTLDGLEQQALLDTLVCSQNDSLVDYCSISALDIDSLYIKHNAYNPTWEEITGGLCLKPEEE